ncbi:hypothetical protein U9M48_019213 [Paspalum notatum var. saurae]|uniref:Retrotransposon gag domain-containing protein n=1 Tax=Paspalum notatum var. saurae TaxID=547442 RepID=A0AAQ3TEV2_PASNO
MFQLGVMSPKKEEFPALTQGTMTVGEYRDKFLHMVSRYRPEEVNTDPKKRRFPQRLGRSTRVPAHEPHFP